MRREGKRKGGGREGKRRGGGGGRKELIHQRHSVGELGGWGGRKGEGMEERAGSDVFVSCVPL